MKYAIASSIAEQDVPELLQDRQEADVNKSKLQTLQSDLEIATKQIIALKDEIAFLEHELNESKTRITELAKDDVVAQSEIPDEQTPSLNDLRKEIDAAYKKSSQSILKGESTADRVDLAREAQEKYTAWLMQKNLTKICLEGEIVDIVPSRFNSSSVSLILQTSESETDDSPARLRNRSIFEIPISSEARKQLKVGDRYKAEGTLEIEGTKDFSLADKAYSLSREGSRSLVTKYGTHLLFMARLNQISGREGLFLNNEPEQLRLFVLDLDINPDLLKPDAPLKGEVENIEKKVKAPKKLDDMEQFLLEINKRFEASRTSIKSANTTTERLEALKKAKIEYRSFIEGLRGKQLSFEGKIVDILPGSRKEEGFAVVSIPQLDDSRAVFGSIRTFAIPIDAKSRDSLTTGAVFPIAGSVNVIDTTKLSKERQADYYQAVKKRKPPTVTTDNSLLLFNVRLDGFVDGELPELKDSTTNERLVLLKLAL